MAPRKDPPDHNQEQDKHYDREDPAWLAALKLLLIALVIVGGTGLALWYFAKHQDDPLKRDPAKSEKSDWGIVNDSPIHRLH